MTTATDALDRFAGRVCDLYSLPAVAVKVLELARRPHIDLRELKSCIEYDPALAAKVLRVVNSSLFGLSREVRDLNQALALLGITPLKLLVLGFSLSEVFCSQVRGPAVDRYWRQTLTRAVAAREISERIWNLPGDEAFLAALLQEVGVLVLLAELGEPYCRFLDRAFTTGKDPLLLEPDVLGFDHRQLAARLLDQWRLPSVLVAAIRRSSQPASIEDLPPTDRALPRILRLAQLMADLVVDRRHTALEQLLAEPAAAGPLSSAQIEELVATLESRVEQLAGVFAFELPAGTDYRDVLVEAHRQMSRLAGDLAIDLLKPPKVETLPEEAMLLTDVEDLAAAVARVSSRNRLAHAAAGQAGPKGTGYSEPKGAESEPKPARLAGRAAASQSAAAASAAAEEPAADAQAERVQVDSGATLSERLEGALSACRKRRVPLSVVLLEIDRFEAVARTLGPIVAEQWVRRAGLLCESCDLPGAESVQSSQAGFALILPGCDRGEAVAVAVDLLVRFREATQRPGSPAVVGLSASVGVSTAASPAKNFRVGDLLDSAARCLSTAQLSGGNSLKSIGIY